MLLLVYNQINNRISQIFLRIPNDDDHNFMRCDGHSYEHVNDQGVVPLVCGDNGKVDKVEEHRTGVLRASTFSQTSYDSSE